MSVSGRPFLQIPGPTNVPDRILRAMDRPVIDHRSPEFAGLTREILPPLREVFGTREGVVVLYPSSGTGAWEASLVNVLALMPNGRCETPDGAYYPSVTNEEVCRTAPDQGIEWVRGVDDGAGGQRGLAVLGVSAPERM